MLEVQGARASVPIAGDVNGNRRNKVHVKTAVKTEVTVLVLSLSLKIPQEDDSECKDVRLLQPLNLWDPSSTRSN